MRLSDSSTTPGDLETNFTASLDLLQTDAPDTACVPRSRYEKIDGLRPLLRRTGWSPQTPLLRPCRRAETFISAGYRRTRRFRVPTG